MSIARSGVYEERVGGEFRRLVLRNGEIERFEEQHDLGIFEVWDQLFGRGERGPQARHVRDLIALALVGGGMSDRAADELVGSLPPSENLVLRETAKRVLGVTFLPAVLDQSKKKEAGSPARSGRPKRTTAPATKS
ncbi:GTA-gp10 family protein [Salipiger sp. PrR007]|uniref:GTA-gp10 family protein n=1 Tax=Salipiger sp. PrR007 TaxID=2706884 RepID=UPI0013B9BBDA|nr:GTA-gp10 family protein [Salipiger sp. PrR007]NDW30964.1 gene transfer agent family protein [Salipiger sp. PrR007]